MTWKINYQEENYDSRVANANMQLKRSNMNDRQITICEQVLRYS